MATAPEMPPEEAEAEPRGMDDNELAALLASHESRAIGYYDSEIADEQAKAINYYYGLMDDLPAAEGCSSVVDHSVAIHVDNALAAVLKPFVSADEVVMFEPRGPEDVAVAEQATEYVNYVINCDNQGFLIFHSWFKDALLTKVGIVKAWWEDLSQNTTQETMMDDAGLLQARQDPNYLGEQEIGPGVYSVDMQQADLNGKIKIENVPPEEFLITPFARSVEDASYVAHRPSNYTRSDLIELGFDADIVADLPAWAPGTNEETRQQARYRDEQRWSTADTMTQDPSRDVIGIIDEYVRCDYDGDGIAEQRRVIRVSDTILFNEPVDDNPFALLCPCPMPHKVYGRGLADQAMEGQKVSTAIKRQTLDNLYKTNNPRPIVPDQAMGESTSDDLGDSSPGAVIRVKQPGMLDWAVVPFSADKSFGMLEYIAQETEERTGIQRKGNGFNAEALRKNSPDTATQAAIDENSRNERAEMIARIFAETGVKRLFKIILNLLSKHQPKARVIRLRNQWVPIDPRGWPEMDVAISVGLGVGNKAEQIAQAGAVLETMERLAATPYAYLVGPEHVHKAVQRLYTATGIKNVDDYIADPSQVEPPEPQPDPKMAEAQAKAQLEQQKLQSQQQEGAMKLQMQQAEAAAKFQIAQAEAQAKAQIEAAKLQLEQAKADFQAQLALQESQQQYELERIKLEMARENNAEANAIKREGNAMKKERPGGDLSK